MARKNQSDDLAYQKSYYARNRERILARAKARWAAMPARERKEANAYASFMAKENKYWVKRYGLEPEQYNAMAIDRGPNCPICKYESKPVVDHCHETGFVRGLICRGCNTALGLVRDDPRILRALADYLEKSAKAFILS